MTNKLDARTPPARLLSAFGLVCALILIVAAAIRAYASLNELWLDEIMALVLARQVPSPLHIFTGLHTEINHHLYSLYLWSLGSASSPLVCRVPSVIAGVGSVILAGLIGHQRGKACAFCATFLVSFSYVMVLYSSEARGYALAVFFALLAFWLLSQHLVTGNLWLGFAFAVSATLGLLSQLVFLGFYLAALAWSAFRWARSAKSLRQVLPAAATCHTLPLFSLALLYFLDLRQMSNLGGTASSSLLQSCETALAWAAGNPASLRFELLPALLALVVSAAGLFLLYREQSDLWLFFLVLLVCPVLLLIVRGSLVIYVRYFVVSIVFFLLLASYWLASIWSRSLGSRCLCVLLLLSYGLANGWHLTQLFRFGRGQYREALNFIARTSPNQIVTIGSNQDFRSSILVQFYAPDAMAPKQAQYISREAWRPEGTEWLICQRESLDEPVPPAIELADARGNRYEFAKSFLTAPLSGLHWFLYTNRLDVAPSPAQSR